MTTLFGSKAGYVTCIDDPDGNPPLPLTIGNPGDWGGFNARTAIVTGVGIARNSKAQMRQMFGSHIYVYVFGEGIADIVLSGLLFPAACPALGTQGKHGVAGVMDFFSDHAAHARKDPLTITIGASIGFEAILLGIRVDIMDADSGIGKFVMQLRAGNRDQATATPPASTGGQTTSTPPATVYDPSATSEGFGML